jgi:hypothetical protein
MTMPGKHSAPQSVENVLADEVRELVYGEMSRFLAGVEERVARAYAGEKNGPTHVISGGKVYAEDMNLMKHQLTGYTVTANTPGAGSIAWASLHVVYNGTDNTITDGNTNLKYVWFDPAISSTTLQTNNTKPDLSSKPNAALLFVNNAGVPFDVLAASIPSVLANNAVDAAAIQQGAVTATKMNTIQHLLY